MKKKGRQKQRYFTPRRYCQEVDVRVKMPGRKEKKKKEKIRNLHQGDNARKVISER
jgi:hypothetical protein